tara:strand:+ start:768 stop:893 length:126 start_codon:yes stop_codon:yes gene_type:complete
MGTCASIFMVSFFIYNFWMLEDVRKEHDRLEEEAERTSKKT